MAEETMPAAEAAVAGAEERTSYEFAFHVLPTVAEGEVAGVFETLKSVITKGDGELFDEEAPERIDLAYDIVKAIDGKNRRFHSAYFGWVRFRLESDKLEELIEELDARPEILRYLMLKLTKNEEQHPFRYHEAQNTSKVQDVEVQDIDPNAVAAETDEEPQPKKELDDSLEEIADGTDVTKESTDEAKT